MVKSSLIQSTPYGRVCRHRRLPLRLPSAGGKGDGPGRPRLVRGPGLERGPRLVRGPGGSELRVVPVHRRADLHQAAGWPRSRDVALRHLPRTRRDTPQAPAPPGGRGRRGLLVRRTVTTELRGRLPVGRARPARAEPAAEEAVRRGRGWGPLPRGRQVLGGPERSRLAGHGRLGTDRRSSRRPRRRRDDSATPRLRVLPELRAADLPEQARGPHGVQALPQLGQSRFRPDHRGRPVLFGTSRNRGRTSS